MSIRIILGVYERLPVDDVELAVKASLAEIGFDQIDEDGFKSTIPVLKSTPFCASRFEYWPKKEPSPNFLEHYV